MNETALTTSSEADKAAQQAQATSERYTTCALCGAGPVLCDYTTVRLVSTLTGRTFDGLTAGVIERSIVGVDGRTHAPYFLVWGCEACLGLGHVRPL